MIIPVSRVLNTCIRLDCIGDMYLCIHAGMHTCRDCMHTRNTQKYANFPASHSLCIYARKYILTHVGVSLQSLYNPYISLYNIFPCSLLAVNNPKPHIFPHSLLSPSKKPCTLLRGFEHGSTSTDPASISMVFANR